MISDFRKRRPAAALYLLILSLVACTNSFADAKYDSAFVTTQDGARIHYIHGGKAGDRPAVVFIPGWTWSASVWEKQMTDLSASRRVIAMDPRSQGDSSKMTDGNTPENRAGDVEALLAQLDAGPVVLVGWSQGVQDVAAYIDRFGTKRLAAVVLVDSSLSAGSAGIDLDTRSAKLLLDRITLYAEYPREYLNGSIDAARAQPFSDEEKAHLVALARKTPTSTAISMLITDMFSKDRRGVVSKMDKPTLVIASATSEELDEQKAMARAIPLGAVVVIEDAGHAVFLDQPAAFSRELSRFLDSLGAS
jgi:pimeloyl-ACP methyl ester carboxylesterase